MRDKKSFQNSTIFSKAEFKFAWSRMLIGITAQGGLDQLVYLLSHYQMLMNAWRVKRIAICHATTHWVPSTAAALMDTAWPTTECLAKMWMNACCETDTVPVRTHAKTRTVPTGVNVPDFRGLVWDGTTIRAKTWMSVWRKRRAVHTAVSTLYVAGFVLVLWGWFLEKTGKLAKVKKNTAIKQVVCFRNLSIAGQTGKVVKFCDSFNLQLKKTNKLAT